MHHLNTTLPLALIKAYRLIPCRIRKVWSFGSSSSHLALAAVHDGGGWAAVWRYGHLHTTPGTGLLWAGKSGEKLDWVPTTSMFENKSWDN